MCARLTVLGVLGWLIVAGTGCGGGSTPKAPAEQPKTTPTSASGGSSSAEANEPPADSAAQESTPPAGDQDAPASGDGAASKEEPPAEAPRRRRVPTGMTSGDGAGGGGSASSPAATPEGGNRRRTPTGMTSGSGGSGSSTGGSSASSAAIDGDTGSTGPPPQQSGPPQGSNNLPPGYGGQGGPPTQSGPPSGFNNLPPGYGGQGGPPTQSGPPPGYNNQPPGYGGQGGPPPQSGPPSGFNNAPPGYSQGPPQQGSGASSAALEEDGAPAPPNFAGPNRNAPAAPSQLEETSFWNMAINAYGSGRDADAYKFLLAEFASNRAKFDESPLNFYASEKKTTIGNRLGIAVSYIAKEGVSGKPPVIGDPAPVVNRGNQRGSRSPGAAGGNSGPPAGFSGGGMGGGGGAVPTDARGMLTYYGGDLATALLEELETKFKRQPAYGNVWTRLNAKVMLPAAIANSGGGQANASAGTSRSRTPSGIGAGSGGGSSAFGPGGQSNSAPEGLFPGLTFLGEGNFAELVRKAKNEGLDGLILLEHHAAVVRSTGATTSHTTVKFYTCDDGKEKASTAQLGYAAVANQVKEGKDPVGKELTSFLTKIERLVAVGEMPTLTEEMAKGRLESIVESSKDAPLPFVNEVNYYLHKGWVNEDDAQALIIKVLGEPAALALWSGDFEKQKSALSRWLPAK